MAIVPHTAVNSSLHTLGYWMGRADDFGSLVRGIFLPRVPEFIETDLQLHVHQDDLSKGIAVKSYISKTLAYFPDFPNDIYERWFTYDPGVPFSESLQNLHRTLEHEADFRIFSGTKEDSYDPRSSTYYNRRLFEVLWWWTTVWVEDDNSDSIRDVWTWRKSRSDRPFIFTRHDPDPRKPMTRVDPEVVSYLTDRIHDLTTQVRDLTAQVRDLGSKVTLMEQSLASKKSSRRTR